MFSPSLEDVKNIAKNSIGIDNPAISIHQTL